MALAREKVRIMSRRGTDEETGFLEYSFKDKGVMSTPLVYG